jgi:hypothetical protein
MRQNPILAIFETLARHQAEYLVDGDLAAALCGAPASTLGVAIVHSTTPENVARILAALEELDARYRFPAELRPGVSHLASPGHQLLMTRCGPFDVLGRIGKGRTYFDLLPLTVEMEVRSGVGGEKDTAMLPLLRRTLEESRKSE